MNKVNTSKERFQLKKFRQVFKDLQKLLARPHTAGGCRDVKQVWIAREGGEGMYLSSLQMSQ